MGLSAGIDSIKMHGAEARKKGGNINLQNDGMIVKGTDGALSKYFSISINNIPFIIIGVVSFYDLS